jgi:peptidyl-prolyl cis-trans isomerase C
MSKNAKLILSASLLLFAATGCQKKAEGQVVAVVNGEEITQQDLNAELQGAQIPPEADKKAIMAQLLQRVIDRKLLVQKAKAEGIDKTPAYLEQMRRAEEMLAINLLTSKAAKTIALPDTGSVSNFITANPTLFNGRKSYDVDQIIFAPPGNAAVLKQLEPAHSLDAVAATLTTANVQFARAKGKLDTAMIPPDAASKIGTLPPGEPFIMPENGQLVARVITSEQATPTPVQQANPAAVELLRRQAIAKVMQKQLTDSRASAKIDYQTGFAPAQAKK